MGVYRLWRDLGYAVGAVIAGVVADQVGVEAAMWLIAALTFGSGVVVAARMAETRPLPGSTDAGADGEESSATSPASVRTPDAGAVAAVGVVVARAAASPPTSSA